MSDFEEREPKPKKYAEINLTIWDDGELEMDCVRFKLRDSGRGAPRKVIQEDKRAFVEEVDSEAMSEYGLLKFFKQELGIKDTKSPVTIGADIDEDEIDEEDF